MTTIVWDGRTLAGDSQTTQGSRVASLNTQKIFEPNCDEVWSVLGEEVLAFGFGGDAGAALTLQRYLAAGIVIDTEIPQAIVCQALLITAEHNCYLLVKGEESPFPFFVPVTGSEAIGSGADFALAALHCGKDAVGAVEIAKEMDVFTGGSVVTWSLPADEGWGEIPF